MLFMNIKHETDKTETIRLDAENIKEITFHTFCGLCGKKMEFAESEFFESSVALGGMGKDYISSNYGSAWYCSSCSDKVKITTAGIEIDSGFKIYKPVKI